MNNRRKIVCIVSISLLYWIGFMGYETNFFHHINPVLKHGINFFLILSVAIIGYYFFLKNAEGWVTALWLMIYSSIITLISIFGAIDLIRRFDSYNFRDLFGYLRMFFTSPLPFSVMLFISTPKKRTFKSKKLGQLT